MHEADLERARRKRIPEHKHVFGVDVLGPDDAHAIGRERPRVGHVPRGRLSQWFATAICGNDITSSCLYVAAICTAYAGRLAPVCLLLVAGLLYLFRSVYGEVVGALPLNGGAYNALLNTSSKFKASIAACMTILSYIATAVISAKTAVEYASLVVPLPILPVTVCVLGAFALLAILGISESARVALVIFVFHMLTLVVLVAVSVWFLVLHREILAGNWSSPLPEGHGWLVAIFFGFASGLLGISGFESSANFVEEQAPGVFPKTLRNMWIAVSVFNPLIALLALSVMPIAEIVNETNRDFLLASMGAKAGGVWLQYFISIDAALVLCGAVLTSFVGVGGLVRRMALDRCLPQFLLLTNRRGTTYLIFLLFAGLCASILVLTGGDLFALAGVYTISFLGVMALFVVGNMLLKIRRARLPRPERAGWMTLLVCLLAACAGIAGNVIIDQRYLGYFLAYFVPTVAVVAVMLLRVHLLKLTLVLAAGFTSRILSLSRRFSASITAKMDEINSLGIIFFADGDEDLATLNNAMLYVRQNELTKRVRVVHLHEGEPSEVTSRLAGALEMLDEVYPEIKIEFVVLPGRFDPAAVEEISTRFHVPHNYMFMGHPSEHFPYRLEEFSGVRLIV